MRGDSTISLFRLLLYCQFGVEHFRQTPEKKTKPKHAAESIPSLARSRKEAKLTREWNWRGEAVARTPQTCSVLHAGSAWDQPTRNTCGDKSWQGHHTMYLLKSHDQTLVDRNQEWCLLEGMGWWECYGRLQTSVDMWWISGISTWELNCSSTAVAWRVDVRYIWVVMVHLGIHQGTGLHCAAVLGMVPESHCYCCSTA